MHATRIPGLLSFNLLQRLNTWGRTQKAKPLDLSSAGAWDGRLQQNLVVMPNGSTFAIANPSAIVPDAFYTVWVEYQTAHGITWGTTFKGVSAITPTATAGAYDFYAFRANRAGTLLGCIGYGLNVGA